MESCVQLAAPTNVGKVGIEACANVSKCEVSNTTKMDKLDKRIVRGGTKESRNALFKERTQELIEKLLNEAGESRRKTVVNLKNLCYNVMPSRYFSCAYLCDSIPDSYSQQISEGV